MDAQLRLLPDDVLRQAWQLDDETIRTGRQGVALARQALRAARRPRPDEDEQVPAA